MNGDVSRRGLLVSAGAACAGSALVGRADGTSGTTPAKRRGADAPGEQSQRAAVAETVADLVETSLDEHDLTGASVAVVADGAVELTAGFGLADRQSERPAEANTPFRVGSVSKAITWTALMRRVQRGSLQPETDVSTVLDVAVPDTNGPVTIADLATHRAGLEDGNSQLWIPDADRIRSLPTHLRQASISQVRPPGEVGSYSNYGAALGGQTLAADRGEPFATAVERELLEPAGMSGSSFRQPLPGTMAERHATGYTPTGRFRNGSFPLVGLRPAGALSTTATDMARFLQLHANDGVVEGRRVLASDTVDALHRQWATHHETLDGVAFGLFEETRDGVRLLTHNGASFSFTSNLVVVPELGLGLFVAFNDATAGEAITDVTEGFLEAVLDTGNADTDETTLTPTGDPERADVLTGTYRSVRSSKTGHDRLTTTLQAPTVTVDVADDGALVTERGGTENRWIEIEPLVFEHERADRRLAFRTAGAEAGGPVEYLCFGGVVSALAPVEGVDRLPVHLAVGGAAALGTGSALVGWPAVAALRGSDDGRVLPAPQRLRSDPSTQAKWVAGGTALAFLSFLVLAVGQLLVTGVAVFSVPPVTFKLSFALPILGTAGTLASVGYGLHAVRTRSWSLLGRLHYLFVTASLVGIVWLLWYWNLLVPP